MPEPPLQPKAASVTPEQQPTEAATPMPASAGQQSPEAALRPSAVPELPQHAERAHPGAAIAAAAFKSALATGAASLAGRACRCCCWLQLHSRHWARITRLQPGAVGRRASPGGLHGLVAADALTASCIAAAALPHEAAAAAPAPAPPAGTPGGAISLNSALSLLRERAKAQLEKRDASPAPAQVAPADPVCSSLPLCAPGGMLLLPSCGLHSQAASGCQRSGRSCGAGELPSPQVQLSLAGPTPSWAGQGRQGGGAGRSTPSRATDCDQASPCRQEPGSVPEPAGAAPAHELKRPAEEAAAAPAGKRARSAALDAAAEAAAAEVRPLLAARGTHALSMASSAAGAWTV